MQDTVLTIPLPPDTVPYHAMENAVIWHRVNGGADWGGIVIYPDGSWLNYDNIIDGAGIESSVVDSSNYGTGNLVHVCLSLLWDDQNCQPLSRLPAEALIEFRKERPACSSAVSALFAALCNAKLASYEKVDYPLAV